MIALPGIQPPHFEVLAEGQPRETLRFKRQILTVSRGSPRGERLDMRV
jgi:hypothetical protein